MELTKKIFSLFICLILGFASLSFAFTNDAQATNNFGWSNITPKSPPLANQDGASAYRYGYNYSWDGYYLHGMTSFTDLVETKSDGSKVIHYFQFMPSSSYGFYQSRERAWGAVVHWSSDTGVWEKINPSFFNQYWTAYGGGFTVLDEPYIDTNGSMWNGRLFLHTSQNYYQLYRYTYTSYIGRYYPGKTKVLRWDGGSSWADLWNQSGTNGNVVSGANGCYSSNDWRGTSSGKYYITSYNGSIYIAVFKDRYPNHSVYPNYYYSPNWDLKIYKYAGSLNDLLNNPTPPQSWTEEWSYPFGSRSWSYGVPGIYEFKVLNDRFFLSTSTTSYRDYAYQSMGNNGMWFVSTNNDPSTLQQGQTISSGMVGTAGTVNRYSWTFPLTYNGITYTARYSYGTQFYRCYPWATYGSSYYYFYYYSNNYYRNLVSGRTVKFSGNIVGNTIYLSALAFAASTSYNIMTMNTPLDSGPSPSTFEYFKGYLYAGFYKNSDLIRTNDFTSFTNLSNLGSWQNCGTVNDPNASPSRALPGSILALEKTSGTDELGNPVDSKLFIGGSYRSGSYSPYAYQYAGTCPLYSTEGEDAGNDPDAVPLKFDLEEDEWRLNKGSTSPNFQNRMFGIYDIYSSNLGLITQFGFQSFPGQSTYTSHSEYKYRKFMVYNAPPSCDVTQTPDPIVNERGTYTASIFTFSPTGGFGSGNVRVTLDLPENVYVPTEDGSGNPVNAEYFNPTIPMNGGILNLPIMIKSTNSAVVNSYRDDPTVMIHITDLTANITVDEFVSLDVIPPKPGFSVTASPSLFTLIQGDCSGIECCEEHCKEITIDLEARNGFEDHVIIGTYWTDPPANQPDGVTFSWKKTSFVYDIFDVSGTGFTSLAEVRVRPEQGTRYLFNVRVSSSTLPGIYKFRIMFLSGAIKRQIDCRMTVLPPRPGIDVSPANGAGTFNVEVFTKEVIPGGAVNYRLLIESKNGFTGKVALSLRGLPEQVYFDNPSGFVGIEAEIPVPGFAPNYVEIDPLLDAFANVKLKTTPYTINPYPPTNLKVVQATNNLNVVSWSASRRGSRNVAGYQVWRSLTKYVDAANLIATIATPNVNYEDADVEAGTPYYYFVRAFDGDTPPNYSIYANSGRVGNNIVVSLEENENETTNINATADKMGTIPGFYNMQVIGNGVGFGPGNVPTNPTSITQLGLHVYRQDLNLKTPFLNVWG
ncbi:MAG: hypothetical protein KAH01_00225, partial [Caldisericia bacterium]|nr:hypothetical protein [Caldisericia bacterium]